MLRTARKVQISESTRCADVTCVKANRKMQTEGLGGPCPQCESMNCFIKKGTSTWYTCIACPDCLFAYGENADSMIEETEGVVSGSDVWIDVLHAHSLTDKEKFDNFFDVEDEDDMHRIETPFAFRDSDLFKFVCTISDNMLETLMESVEPSEKEEFIEAAANDEYGEYTLNTGDVLITDWEGDGVFDPFVIPDTSDNDSREVEDELAEAIQNEFDIEVRNVEWSNQGLYLVRAEKPEM